MLLSSLCLSSLTQGEGTLFCCVAASLSQHDTVAKLAKRRVRVSVDLDDVVVRADATSDSARRRRLVRRRPRQLYSATVLYCSRGVLDLAVLRIDASISGLRHTRLPKWPHMPLRRTAVPRDGDALYAVGHGLLDPKAGASPSVYAGTAARCVWLNNKPAMVQVRVAAVAARCVCCSVVCLSQQQHLFASG